MERCARGRAVKTRGLVIVEQHSAGFHRAGVRANASYIIKPSHDLAQHLHIARVREISIEGERTVGGSWEKSGRLEGMLGRTAAIFRAYDDVKKIQPDLDDR